MRKRFLIEYGVLILLALAWLSIFVGLLLMMRKL